MVPCPPLRSKFCEGFCSSLSDEGSLQLVEDGPDLGHGPSVRRGQIDLLSNGHQADLSAAKSLQEGDLLRCVSAQSIHSDDNHCICLWTTRLQQMGNLPAPWTFRQKFGAAHSSVGHQLNQLCSHGLTPGRNPGFLSIERHAIRSLLDGAHSGVSDHLEWGFWATCHHSL